MLNIPCPAMPGTVTARASAIQINLPSKPVRYYRHGWQSWSLAAWTDLKPLPVQKPARLHPLQVDPRYAKEMHPNGSWLGAVGLEDGSIVLLGALGLDAHVSLEGSVLSGFCTAGEVGWLIGRGGDDVFAEYAHLLEERLGSRPGAGALRVWCSWYSLYQAIDEGFLGRIFDGLEGLPFDVLQVDDGWQAAIGDWQANDRFPSGMARLAENIRSRGRRAGLWLSPLIATPSSQLFHRHPDWWLRGSHGELVSAGFNWGEPLYALDTTHPGVTAWLAELMQQVRSWGFDYLKLDFLYAGALEGRRFQDMPREAAFRQALQLLRSAMGEDAFFLGCGVPILPSLGICDAIRTGPDVGGEWENHRDAYLFNNPTTPSVKNAVRTVLHRLWLRPLVQMDPDVAYFTARGSRLTPQQKAILQVLAHITGFRATSDLPQWMTAAEREEIRTFLTGTPEVRQTGRYKYAIDGHEWDLGNSVTLPDAPAGFERIAAWFLGWLAEQDLVLKTNYLQSARAWRRLRRSLDLQEK